MKRSIIIPTSIDALRINNTTYLKYFGCIFQNSYLFAISKSNSSLNFYRGSSPVGYIGIISSVSSTYNHLFGTRIQWNMGRNILLIASSYRISNSKFSKFFRIFLDVFFCLYHIVPFTSFGIFIILFIPFGLTVLFA